MKTTNRLFAAALVLFAAAACYNKEIESPDNRQGPQTPDISEQTGLKITASITQTRVSYSDNDTDPNNKILEQQWEVNDIVFGFIEDDNSTSVVLKVTEIDVNGIAKLVPTTGGKALSAMNENTNVFLIYTGGAPLELSNNSYTVDMSSQSEKIPACMHASAKKSNDALEFHFVNDCAIFEIVSLTGVAEDHSSDSQDLKSITVSNVFTSGKYTFGENGSVSFDGVSGQVGNATITFGDGWTVDDEGTIMYDGEARPVLIAVAPKTADENAGITITAEADKNIHYGYDFGSKSVVATKCYVAKAKPVVAKTSDGQYFTSVFAAFEHAAVLSGQGYNTAAQNVVTLIKKEINGFREQTTSTTHDSCIEIDYPVTLDLNGCTLSLSGIEGFYVMNDYFAPLRGALTITDNTGPDDKGEYAGEIDSESDNPIIHNLSTVIIDGGNLYYTFNPEGNYYVYSMIENEGGSLKINNDSYLQADGNIPADGEKYYLIKNLGEIEVNGGYLYSFDDDIITIGNYCDDTNSGTVTINDGEVYSEKVSAIESVGGEVVITGGVIDNESFSKETIQVLYGATCTISGGLIYSVRDFSAIGCRSSNIGKDQSGSSILTVKWPNNVIPAELSADTGPIILTYGSNHFTAPISTEYPEVDFAQYDNTAVVHIQGGYLISYSDVFFVSDEEDLIADVLDVSTFGNFYSNVKKIQKDGDTYNSDNVEKNYFDLSNEISLKNGYLSRATYVGSGFEIPYLSEVDIEDLYLISTRSLD